MLKSVVTAVALAIASLGSAHAAVLNLNDYLGNANVFSFTDFSAPYADVQGAILAGGNVTLTSYSVNVNKQSAYGQYSLVVGGNLDFSNGSINNGNVYVGGSVTYPSWGAPLGKGYTTVSGTAPVNLTQLASGLTKTSAELAAITSTAATSQVGSQIFLTGSKSAVDVVTVSTAMMNSGSEFVLSNFATDATIIVNVVGNSATIQGGYQQFDKYNVLFNFVDATKLNINSGANISILAPAASVDGGQGVIDGNVVVKSWSSGVQINSTNAFVSTNVNGLVTAIPEPETYAMLLGGLGLMGFMARRRQKAAAPAR